MKQYSIAFLIAITVCLACRLSSEAEAAVIRGESGCEGTACRVANADGSIEINLLALNDFHGNLESSTFRYTDEHGSPRMVRAGGIEALGTLITQLRASLPNTMLVGGGDLVGASPFLSNYLRDEPTIAALNKLGMAVSVVGNHEFDRGVSELMRLQHGGCATEAGSLSCRFEPQFGGANYAYVVSNVVERATGKTLFPPYSVKNIGGINVGFVGAIVEDLRSVVSPTSIAAYDITNPAVAINQQVRELKQLGVTTIVALVHDGGSASESFDVSDCSTLSGPVVGIARQLDPEVDVVVSGHSHQGYQCRVDGRLVTQAEAAGRLLTHIRLTVDPKTSNVLTSSAENLVVNAELLPPNAEMTAIRARAHELVDPIARTVVANIGQPQITRKQNAAGESQLGDLLADAQLAAAGQPSTGGAVVAFVNPGTMRTDLPAVASNSFEVTYGECMSVQPFGNSLVVKTLTGAQILAALEQQFDNPSPRQTRILQVSYGFAYSYDSSRPAGSRVARDSVRIKGKVVDPAGEYRVVMNSFLADGGDCFSAFRGGTDVVGGVTDIEAFVDYLEDFVGASTIQGGRILREYRQ